MTYANRGRNDALTKGKGRKEEEGKEGEAYMWNAPNPSTNVRSERGGGGRELEGDPTGSKPKRMEVTPSGSGRQDKRREVALLHRATLMWAKIL